MRDLQQMCLCAVVLKNGSTGSPNRKGSDGGVHHDLQRSNKLHEKHKQWLQWKRLIALTASAFACCHFASAEGWSAQTARTRVARTNWLFYIFFNHFISIPVYFISFCINHAWRISEADSPRLQGKLEAWQRWSPYTERPRPPLWSAPAGHHGNRWDTSLQELRERHFINLVTDNVLKESCLYQEEVRQRTEKQDSSSVFLTDEKSASNFPQATEHPFIYHECNFFLKSLNKIKLKMILKYKKCKNLQI